MRIGYERPREAEQLALTERQVLAALMNACANTDGAAAITALPSASGKTLLPSNEESRWFVAA
jgi:hypothetical protein